LIRNGKKTVWIIGCLATAMIISTGYGIYYFTGDKILNGIPVGTIDISRLSKAEAVKKLNSYPFNPPIYLTFHGQSRTFRPDGLCQIDAPKTVQKAWATGRKRFWKQWLAPFRMEKTGCQIGLVIKVNETALKSKLESLKREIDRPAIPAQIIGFNQNQLIIKDEVPGWRLDTKKLRLQLIKTLSNGCPKPIPLPVVPVQPKLTRADILKYHFTIIGSFITEFNPESKERTHNLALSAQAIHGTILAPDELFSYNQIVGQRVSERGYQQANVMVKGVLTPGVGGGVCQVSTTLYSAALMARLKIIARNSHERPIDYALPGQDATVNYGTIDLKFRNNRPSPILIHGKIIGNKIRVDIWGEDLYPGEEVQLSPVIDHIIAYNTIEKTDPHLPPNERTIARAGQDGYEVSLYRIIMKNGLEIKRELINQSHYMPLPELVNVGRHPSY
jgi:vancomycin resistance protein YoaR